MVNKLIIILLLFVTSCVSLKSANNINKAENRIIKYNTGIKNQIDRYPSLADLAYKVIIKDTVKIKGDSTEFDIEIYNRDSLENINNFYQTSIDSSNKVIDSLLNVPLKDYPQECQYIVDDLQNRISVLGKEIKYQQRLTTKWFNKYNNSINTTFNGYYEDSIFKVDYSYYNGVLNIQPSTKDKYIIVDKEEYNYNVKIRKHFWQDLKFYPFLIVLISLFYFFGDVIFTVIKKLIRLFI